MKKDPNEKCPFCGMLKYESGVRNCCEEGEAEEYAENLEKHKDNRMLKLLVNIAKIVEANDEPSQPKLF